MNASTPLPSMGILQLHEGSKKFNLARYTPDEQLGFFIKHFWIVSWDLTGHEPHPQHVVPNPCVNLVVERSRTACFGPSKHKFSYLIEGKGCVFGVKFKPGGFYPFIRQPLSDLTLRPLSLEQALGLDTAEVEQAILSRTSEQDMVALMEGYIRPRLPERDENIVFVNEIIDRVAMDRDITKVDHICEQFHLNKRTLQRLFDQYVGVSPKWVIKLSRLQNAAQMLDAGAVLDWAQLSLQLGYHDQSHFIKDFKSIIGQTPEEYVRKS